MAQRRAPRRRCSAWTTSTSPSMPVRASSGAPRSAPSPTSRSPSTATRPSPSSGSRGAVKTTLGKASLRVVKPARGSVWFDGQDITALGEEEIKPFRRRAQAVFQDPYSSINSFHERGPDRRGTAGDPRRRRQVRAGGPGARGACLRRPHPRRSIHLQVPPHPLRRPATARRDRQGLGHGPGLRRGRRAGLDDRRLQPRRDSLPDAGLAAPVRQRLPLHHPRHRQRGALSPTALP